MHIPNGHLDPTVAGAAAAVAVAAIGYAAHRVRQTADPTLAPRAGLVAASVFAAQLANFPISHDASGHLLGGTLVAVVLGPWAAILAMASVLVVQCVVFGDGGLTALGANICTMAIVCPLVGGLVSLHRAAWFSERLTAAQSGSPLPAAGEGLGVRGRTPDGSRSPLPIAITAAGAGFASVLLAATVCASFWAVSGVAPWTNAVSLMLDSHWPIAIAEAGFTGLLAGILACAGVFANAPSGATRSTANERWVVAATMALVLAMVVAPIASTLPDGMTVAAQQLGITETALAFRTLMPDYQIATVASAALSAAIACGFGMLLVLGSVGIGIAMLQRVPVGSVKSIYVQRTRPSPEHIMG